MKRVLIALLMLVLMSVSISADGQYKVSIDGGLYGTPSDTEVTVAFSMLMIRRHYTFIL